MLRPVTNNSLTNNSRPEPERSAPALDYRPAFYEQYFRALNLVPTRLSDAQLQRVVRQFAGRWDRWLPSDRTVPCVDLGCGTGEFLHYLRQRGFTQTTGVDLSAEELEIAKALGANQVHRANALDYVSSLPPQSLGLVSAFNFFEHLNKSEILEILPRIYAALKPGGVLLAVTPNGLSPFAGATRYWDFSHETGFTPASWRQVARLSGFSEMSFEEYGPIPHSALGALRSVAWRGISLGLQVISFIEVGSARDPSRVYTADMKIILKR